MDSKRFSEPLPITVIIPAFNRAETIERAIESVHAQSMMPSEIIVVDDASKDDTAKIASSLGAKVVVHDSNQGAGPARNTGIANTSNPWIAFLDSDDEWLPDHVQRVWRYIDDYILVGAPGISVPSGTRKARLVGNASPDNYRLNKPLDVLEPENRIATSGAFIRTDIAREVGGFTAGRRVQDLDFWIRVLEHGSGIALNTPGFLYNPSVRTSTNPSGARRAAMDYLRGYVDQPWFDVHAMRRTIARQKWDELRAALGERETFQGLEKLLWLTTHPQNWLAVLQMLQFRRLARKRGKYFWQHTHNTRALLTEEIRPPANLFQSSD